MKTELEIIYTIWDIVRGGETNNDDPINERLMRQFLRIHRGRTLSTAYKKGDTIPDECFQSLGTINFELKNKQYISIDNIPKTIRLKNNAGLMLNKDGLVIPVLNSLEFDNAPKDQFNKFHPKLKFINRKFIIDLGMEQIGNQIEDLSNTLMNSTVRKFKQESKFNTVNISGYGVLVNTDDESGYDWTKDAYPMPDELIENLINSVNAREFNIFLKMKPDETGDNRNDSAEHITSKEI